jgi:hypothetical protein
MRIAGIGLNSFIRPVQTIPENGVEISKSHNTEHSTFNAEHRTPSGDACATP